MHKSDKTKGAVDPAIQMDAFSNLARRLGLRITPQRTAVYKKLAQSKKHPSAEMLYRQVKKELPNISLDTVNRTLMKLAQVGAAFIVEGSGEPKRFDANLENHQHFRCTKCKKIIDFHYEPFDNIPVPDDITKKYIVTRKTVYLEGICDSCKKKSRSKKSS